MGRLEIDGRGSPPVERGFPPGNADAPAIARLQSGEAPFRVRSHKVVAVENGEVEEFFCHLHADGVQADIFRAGPAIAVTIKTGKRITATTAKLSSENVGRHPLMVAEE